MKVFEKREYQERIISKAIAALTCENTSTLIESPTGSGKSYMATQIIDGLAKISNASAINIVWVAHRSKLLEQGMSEALESGVLNDERINFTPLSSFCKDGSVIESLKNPDLIIYDEAQHSVSDTSVDLCHALNPKRIMGLSATPFRSDSIKLSFDSVIRDAGINRLIKDGYLSKYDMYSVSKYSPEFLAKLYVDYQEMWGKTIAYWHTQEESDRFLHILHENGINAKGVYGNMHTSVKERAMDDFEAGIVPILSNLMLLTEGYDSPTLRTVFCKPSVKGLTIQMAGRALRPHEYKTHANIVQLGASKGHDFKFPKIAHPRNTFEYHEGEWIQVGIDRNKLDKLHSSVRKVSAQIALDEPVSSAFIGKRKKRSFAAKVKRFTMESRFDKEVVDLESDQFDNRNELEYAD